MYSTDTERQRIDTVHPPPPSPPAPSFHFSLPIPIKKVTVVGDKDVRFDLQDVFKELPNHSGLVGYVPHGEGTLVLRLGRVLKVLHVRPDHLPIGQQVALD